MRLRGNKQQGMASIVVVSVLIIIMTLISIGFARLVDRVATSSADKQFSASATYAAESGINDVAAYLKQYATANPGSDFLPQSTKCNGPGSLIGSNSTPGPFYSDSNLAGDTNRSTQYTCILLNPTPSDLVYTQVPSLKSQVVKVNTSAVSGALDKLMISWQPSDSTINGYPVGATSLRDETTWNSSTSNCKDSGGDNASCIPVLRVTLYPISNGESLNDVQAQSKTVFLYPQTPSGNVMVKSYTDNSNFKDGSLIPVPCTQTIGSNDFNPSTNANYKCNIIISDLASAISPNLTDSVYLRLTPIYNQADIQIAANDKSGGALNFINDQAVVDVTAQTSGVAKRLQARVDTSSLAANSGGVNTNISPNSDAIPEQSVRSANALCKREIQTTVFGVSFVNFDDPDTVCHDLSSTNNITNPVPQLTLSITGQNGKDNGLTLDSEQNNPDSPQSPVQQSTVYVGTSQASPGGSVTINWNTVNATSCTATGGSSGWAGEKNGIMNFSLDSNDDIIASGSQSFSGVTSVSTYTLVCSRPYAPSNSATKKVTAWPYPQASISVPSSIQAGQPYTVSWSSDNVNSNGCVLTGDWPDRSPTGTSGSETVTWTQAESQNPNYSKSFSVKCTDPIGRFATDTKGVGAGCSAGGSCNGGTNGCPSGGCDGSGNGNVRPPDCSANVSYTGGSINNTTVTWSTNCDYYDSVNYWEGDRYITTNVPGVPTGLASPGYLGSGSRSITTVGTYCMDVEAWADGWTTKSNADSAGPSGVGAANSGNQCITVGYPQVVIEDYVVLAWDNGPVECGYDSPGVRPYNNTWQCRNGNQAFDTHDGATRAETIGGGGGWGCASPAYRFGVCGGQDYWDVELADGSTPGSIRCTESSTNGAYHTQSGGGHQSSGPWQWTNVGGVYPFTLNCDGPTPGPYGGPNHDSRIYNG